MTRIGPALMTMLGLASCGQPAANGVAADNAASTIANNVATPAAPPFAETPGAHPTAPEAAPIPAPFRGTWADSNSACADLKHHSRLTVSGRTIRHPDFVIVGDEVIASGIEVSVKGHIEATGAPAEAHYSLNPAGTVLTDEAGGGAIRVKCA